jgi:Prokaryotic membrane lipoprotein lipid attachment site
MRPNPIGERDSMRRYISLFGLALVLASCAITGGRMNQISAGMSKAEVIHTLGTPRSSGGRDKIEVLHYRDDNGFWLYDYYFVRLVDGKVESYGQETKSQPVTASYPPLH